MLTFLLISAVLCSKVDYGTLPKGSIELADLYIQEYMDTISELVANWPVDASGAISNVQTYESTLNDFMSSYELRRVCGTLFDYTDGFEGREPYTYMPLLANGFDDIDYFNQVVNHLTVTNYYDPLLSYDGLGNKDTAILTPSSDTTFNKHSQCLKKGLKATVLYDLLDEIASLEGELQDLLEEAGFTETTTNSGMNSLIIDSNIFSRLNELKTPISAIGELVVQLMSHSSKSILEVLHTKLSAIGLSENVENKIQSIYSNLSSLQALTDGITADTIALIDKVSNGTLKGFDDVHDCTLLKSTLNDVCQNNSNIIDNEFQDILLDLASDVMNIIKASVSELTIIDAENLTEQDETKLILIFQFGHNALIPTLLNLYEYRLNTHLIGIIAQATVLLYNGKIESALVGGQSITNSKIQFGSTRFCRPVSDVQSCLILSHPAYVSDAFTYICDNEDAPDKISVDYNSQSTILNLLASSISFSIESSIKPIVASNNSYVLCLLDGFLFPFQFILSISSHGYDETIGGYSLKSCRSRSLRRRNDFTMLKGFTDYIQTEVQSSVKTLDNVVLNVNTLIHPNDRTYDVAYYGFWSDFGTDCKDENNQGPTECFIIRDSKTTQLSAKSICSAGSYVSEEGCVLCEKGFYCPGDDNKFSCTNKPEVAYYTNTGVTTELCPFSCPNGMFADIQGGSCGELPPGMYMDGESLLECKTHTSSASVAYMIPNSLFSHHTVSNSSTCVADMSARLSIRLLNPSLKELGESLFNGNGSIGLRFRLLDDSDIVKATLLELPGIISLALDCIDDKCKLGVLLPLTSSEAVYEPFFSSHFKRDALWHQYVLVLNIDNNTVYVRRDGLIVLTVYYSPIMRDDVLSVNYHSLHRNELVVIIGGRETEDKTQSFGHKEYVNLLCGFYGDVFFSSELNKLELFDMTSSALTFTRQLQTQLCTQHVFDALTASICSCPSHYNATASGKCTKETELPLVNGIPYCEKKYELLAWKLKENSSFIVTAYSSENGVQSLAATLKPEIIYHRFGETIEGSCQALTASGLIPCAESESDVYGLISTHPDFITDIELRGTGNLKVEIINKIPTDTDFLLDYSQPRQTVFVGEFDGDEVHITSSLLTSQTGTDNLACEPIGEDISSPYSLCFKSCPDEHIIDSTCTCRKIEGKASTPVIKGTSFVLGEDILISTRDGTVNINICNDTCSSLTLRVDNNIGGAYFSLDNSGKYEITVVHKVPLKYPSDVLYATLQITRKMASPTFSEIDVDVWNNEQYRILRMKRKDAEVYLKEGFDGFIPRNISINGPPNGTIRYIVMTDIVEKDKFCKVKQDGCIAIDNTYESNTQIVVVPPFTVAAYVEPVAMLRDFVSSDIEFIQIDLHPAFKEFYAVTMDKIAAGQVSGTDVVYDYVYETELPVQFMNSLVILIVVVVVIIAVGIVLLVVFPSWHKLEKQYKRKADVEYVRQWLNRYTEDAETKPFCPVSGALVTEALKLPESYVNLEELTASRPWIKIEEGVVDTHCSCGTESNILYECAECVKAGADDIHLMCPQCAHAHLEACHDKGTSEFPICCRLMFCSVCKRIAPTMIMYGDSEFVCPTCNEKERKAGVTLHLCTCCFMSAAHITCLTCDSNLCPRCDWLVHVSGDHTDHTRVVIYKLSG